MATRVPLYIKDDTTASLVAQLAKLKGLSKQDAVKLAVKAELDRAIGAVPLRETMAAWRRDNPMPTTTGAPADKSFFDGLSGDL